MYGIALAETCIFFGTSDHHLDCLNDDGAFLWSYQSAGAIYAVAYDRARKRLVFGAADHLYCVDEKGALVWKERVGKILSLASDPRSGDLFIGLKSGSVRCMNQDKEIVWRYEGSQAIRSLFYADYEERVLFTSKSRGHVKR